MLPLDSPWKNISEHVWFVKLFKRYPTPPYMKGDLCVLMFEALFCHWFLRCLWYWKKSIFHARHQFHQNNTPTSTSYYSSPWQLCILHVHHYRGRNMLRIHGGDSGGCRVIGKSKQACFQWQRKQRQQWQRHIQQSTTEINIAQPHLRFKARYLAGMMLL